MASVTQLLNLVRQVHYTHQIERRIESRIEDVDRRFRELEAKIKKQYRDAIDEADRNMAYLRRTPMYKKLQQGSARLRKQLDTKTRAARTKFKIAFKELETQIILKGATQENLEAVEKFLRKYKTL
jgi:translation initiation factor IF-2